MQCNLQIPRRDANLRMPPTVRTERQRAAPPSRVGTRSMCGVAGFVDSRCAYGAEDWVHTAEAMAAPLRHRGPDDDGVWADPAAGVALAHRRLAIVDLSPAGHQPMTSSCGRWVLTYNGEIYNHAELRDELSASGRTFRGHSDTEVLAEACAAW